ncbi:pyridoxamine 5'-phosphate oxidase family protein [Saccharopolyspora sp. TS4A08]|uniref:Pyridoxamine 5'-phosphate oxidase family protein n=1 Tax=Saccharopolyspora ipomoeae TaxID=3042027 RepID=A0ABT6PII4_9PSEU|nr:MSMEG_1061 family FMN-dependent PPOX-type flavoprotein [Saccharopolyspora sp. TS4A08]MDI2027807.1 pyridoxamine 5'-phosphate oxidase family protein [Saccharopolyspora sp. TS4A08]
MTSWDPAEAEHVTSAAQLREIVEPPHPEIAEKVVSGIDGVSRGFIEQSRLFLVATTGADGRLDVSPRGDTARSVVVFDDGKTLAYAERPGNRRVDGLHNILENPQVGMLFMIPGVTHVLRVNGTATVVRSAPFMADLALKGTPPPLAVVVRVEELFVHCGRALLKSGLWRPRTWPEGDHPGVMALFESQQALKTDPPRTTP